MTPDGLFVLGALLAAFVAIYRGWVGADLALMSGLGLVAVVGVVDPRGLMHGFATTAVVAVASLYVVAAGVRRGIGTDTAGVSQVAQIVESLGLASALRRLTRGLGGDVGGDSGSAPAAVVWGALAVSTGLYAVGTVSFEAASMLAATSYIVFGVVPAEAARSVIDWEVVVAVGALIGFSRALVETGVVSWLGTAVAGGSPAAIWTPALVAIAFALPFLGDRRAAA